MMGKRIRIACLPTSVFLIIDVFPPPPLERRIEQLLLQSLEPTLSVWSRRRGSENLREQVCVHTNFHQFDDVDHLFPTDSLILFFDRSVSKAG